MDKNNYFYKHLKRSVGESLGYSYSKGVNQGFLGLKGNPLVRKAGWKGGMKYAGSLGLRSLPLLGSIYSAYSGYKEGGVWGAAKETASFIGINMAFNMAVGSAGALGAIGLAAAPIAIGATVGYAAASSSRKNLMKYKKLEMGANQIDRFGTIATIRQRSLSSIQNSHINGRMMLGNEAYLSHR